MQRHSGVPAYLYFILLVLFGGSLSWAQSAPQSRIGAMGSGQMAALRGNVPAWARPQYDRGPVNGAMRMEGLSLVFRLSPGQNTALQKLLAEQQDPASPKYHQWLTPDQYADRFGMSPADLSKATAWLQSQGFAVTRVSRSRTSIFFSGTAAQVQAAFHTPIHNYLVNGAQHFSNSAAPVLPAALAGVVLGVRHLNNYLPRPHYSVRTTGGSQAAPHFTSSITGSHFLTPGDFATIYNLTPLYNAGYDGTGETIAVIGETTISSSDVSAFRSAAGLSAVSASNLQTLLVPNTGTAISCPNIDEGEADLDVEWSGGVAKGASVLYVFAGGGTAGSTCSTRTANVFDALQYAIDDDLAPVISISYGNCEANLGSSNATVLQSWVQQANSQGQTLTAASGDDGAADCDVDTSATQGLAVDLPAAVPEVTGVGGTEFTGDASSLSTTTYWTAGSSDVISSARSYIPEIAWNDTAADLAAGATSFSASGGGASIFFAKPSWQTGSGVPGPNHRYVPDVSLSGSNDHDAYLICSQASCTNGFRDSSGNLNVVGGTSVGSQVMGGILAVLNQATSSKGQGNANIEIYTLAASTPSAFHDITTGNNIVPCTTGSTDCPATSPFQLGFTATTGYDQVTGLGTLDVNELAQAWPHYGAPAGYSVSASPTSLTASLGSTKTSTITITGQSGFSGTVSVSCSPAFTVAQVSCSIMSPTSVTLDSNTTSGTVTLNIATIANHAIGGTSADARRHGGLGWMAASSGALFAGVFMIGAPSRRRRWLALIGLAVLVSLAVGVGCGGGSSSNNNSTGTGGSTAGNYTFTVTATSGSLAQTAQVSVTVQ